MYGLLFIGVQTFWVSVIWRGDIRGYILELLITDILFVTGTFMAGRMLFSFRGADVLIYLLAGFAGLVIIEWLFAGHWPGKTEASQFVMFTTWAGISAFARMMTDTSQNIQMVRSATFLFLLCLGGGGTITGLLLKAVNSPLVFKVTYLAANIGYPLMMPFFIVYFVQKIMRPG